MTVSYNGFKAGDPKIFTPPGLDNRSIPGTTIELAPGLHRGPIADVLFYVAGQIHARVEKAVDQADGFWGYAFRPSKNDANLISCHASATAFDYAATKHPNGKRGTFSKAQVAEIRKILKEVDNTVYWGGDAWSGGIPDEMHFEIDEGVTMMQLDEVAAKLKAKPAPKPVPVAFPAWYHGVIGSRTLSKGARGDDVGNLQSKLNAGYPLYSHLMADGIFGAATDKVVREFQKRAGLIADGIVGPATFRKLGI